MKGGWNDAVSPVVTVEDAVTSITFSSDQPAVKPDADGRTLAFLIGNVTFEPSTSPLDTMPEDRAAEPVLQTVTGGYARENDGATWRYWTSKQLEMRYVVPPAMKAMRMKFTYLPASGNRTLKVVVRGRKESVFTLPMKPGWNDYVSPPLPVDDRNLTVRLIGSGQPIRLGPSDPRLASFLIQNLELVNLPPDASQAK
jgi:hypothetical protein